MNASDPTPQPYTDKAREAPATQAEADPVEVDADAEPTGDHMGRPVLLTK